jgi:hypothetical protein
LAGDLLDVGQLSFLGGHTRPGGLDLLPQVRHTILHFYLPLLKLFEPRDQLFFFLPPLFFLLLGLLERGDGLAYRRFDLPPGIAGRRKRPAPEKEEYKDYYHWSFEQIVAGHLVLPFLSYRLPVGPKQKKIPDRLKSIREVPFFSADEAKRHGAVRAAVTLYAQAGLLTLGSPYRLRLPILKNGQ